MRILITGICGFVGRVLAEGLLNADPALKVLGLDNLSRPGSWLNRAPLRSRGVEVQHGDIRVAADVAAMGAVDWVIDAAANPSVLAGVGGTGGSSRQLVGNNLGGTVNLLEHCKACGAGFTLISTSRVYAIGPLASLGVKVANAEFHPVSDQKFPPGLSPVGIAEGFATTAPVSLYGATKLASEALALEYGGAFGFPVWINRCGVLAGAGQFGRADQGIFSYWIHSWREGRPLKYIGFGGNGHQVRDCLHPRDLVPVVSAQLREPVSDRPRVNNFGGGVENSMSLARLSEWCEERFGARDVMADASDRAYDLPWVVMDCARARESWNWRPETSLESVLEEIADHAEANPQWLEETA